MKSKKVLAWHFCENNMKLGYSDARKIIPGETLSVNPKTLELCGHGLHASIKPSDALYYAPGVIICRVELSGEILTATDKLCAEHRKVLWMADAEYCLHEFAVWCARGVLPLFEAQHPEDNRPRLAIEAKELWLLDKISYNELDAARDARYAAGAAWAAAGDARYAAGAARYAAGAACAAWDAACAAACAARAASYAAGNAVNAAASYAAKDAAWNAQNKQLEKMLLELKDLAL